MDTAGLGSVILPREQDELRPEPLERFLYVAGVLLLPFCLAGAYLAVRRLRKSAAGGRAIESLSAPVSWSAAPMVLVLLAAGALGEDRESVLTYLPGGAPSVLAAAVLAAGAMAARRGRAGKTAGRLAGTAAPGFVALLLGAVLLFTVIGPEHVSNHPVFWYSFNAFFYSVVQVFFGRELLADFVNQYGLYPHFVEPLLHLVGFSLYTFTAVMGVLTCLAFWCFYRFLARETDDRYLSFLGVASTLFFGYVAGRVREPDLYLQYHPLRVLFPAVSLAAARAFAHEPSARRGGLLCALGALGALWNPDSGLVVLAAGFLLVLYDTLLRRRPGEAPARLLLGAVVVAAVLAGFSLFLLVRFGALPDYRLLLLYPRAFYAYGVTMLPMPRFGLWVAVLTVYSVALVRSLIAAVEGTETPRARLHFYLGVLGLGSFAYYQGRSTLDTLMASSYPAIILCVLLLDELRRRPSLRWRSADGVLCVTLLALPSYSIPALVTVAPAWVRGIAEKVRVTAAGEEGEPLRNARMLRQWVRPGDKVVIMSYNSGFYHLMTRTTNPLHVPSDSEILYRWDFREVLGYSVTKPGTLVIDTRTMKPGFTDRMRKAHPVHHEVGTLVVFPAP